MSSSLRDFGVTYFRGFGQIMLQQNALTGLLFAIGIALNSVTMLLGGMFGSLVGLLLARVLPCDESSVRSGLYGFNAALVGIAVCFFYLPTLHATALICIGGALSSFVMWLMLTKTPKLPPLTAPFVIATWATLGLAGSFGLTLAQESDTLITNGDFFVLLRGIGQVMFQGSSVTGAVFLLGIALHSRGAALWAAVGSGIGILSARLLGFPEDVTAIGGYGFNASLVGIALSTYYGRDFFPILCGMILSVILTRVFDFTFLVALTAPFVLSTWILAVIVKPHKL